MGRVGLWLERTRNLNQLPVGTCPLGACPGGVNVNYLVPYKGFNQIQIAENAARSTYNGLNVSWNRRFARGLGFGVAYTFSKSYDNGSTRRDVPFNNYDDRSFWGPSNFDTRHIAVINWIYELPYKNVQGLNGAAFGGWQITGITQFQTGTPFTIGTNTDYAGIGTSSFQPWQVNGDANLSIGDRGFSNSGSDSNYWFRVKNSDGSPIFTAPAAGTFRESDQEPLLRTRVLKLEPGAVQVVCDYRASPYPIPGGSFQLAEPSQLGRSQRQRRLRHTSGPTRSAQRKSDQRHIRQGYHQRQPPAIAGESEVHILIAITIICNG